MRFINCAPLPTFLKLFRGNFCMWGPTLSFASSDKDYMEGCYESALKVCF